MNETPVHETADTTNQQSSVQALSVINDVQQALSTASEAEISGIIDSDDTLESAESPRQSEAILLRPGEIPHKRRRSILLLSRKRLTYPLFLQMPWSVNLLTHW